MKAVFIILLCFIMCSCSRKQDLGDGYMLYEADQGFHFINKGMDTVIDFDVSVYFYDDSYIIARRDFPVGSDIPSFSAYGGVFGCFIVNKERGSVYNKISDMPEDEAEILIGRYVKRLEKCKCFE